MWTTQSRALYDLSGLRYPRGLTDGGAAILALRSPPAKRRGWLRDIAIRAVVGGLLDEISGIIDYPVKECS